MKGDGAQVACGLWVGSLAFAQDSPTLEELGVVRVLTFGSRLNPQLEWRSGCKLSGRCYDIEDHPCADLLGVLPSALREIDKIMKLRKDAKDASVLVHCASGISRSVAVCMAWLMLREAMSLQEALEKVKKARPQALPNHGFIQCLRLIETEGDLKGAHKAWLNANAVSQSCRDRSVQKLRERADQAAARAAELEEQLQNLDTENTCLMRKILRALRKLESDIEKLKPRRTIDDNVAHSIRKDTSQKVSHLLSIWEPKLPPESSEEECDAISPTTMLELEDDEADQETMDPQDAEINFCLVKRERVASMECIHMVVSL